LPLSAPIINWMETVFLIVGGLGIFLYGIHKLGDSLKLLAGTRLKKMIEKTTSTPLRGILVGALVTVLLQTSTGTTALTVSLVRAGLMSFPQALGIILGANLGTTSTSFLIGLEIHRYALPVIGLGSLFILFAPSKRFKRLGGVFLGFGMIFYGLDLMGGTLSSLTELEVFRNVLESVGDTPLLGVVTGALLTALVQSSSAVIGILQQLYTTGAMPLIGAVAIVFGSNIGTTITAIIASLGGSTAAKRTAAAHVMFNVFGAVLFFILIIPYTRFILLLQDTFFDGRPAAMTVSLAHIFFNLATTIVMFWLIKYLVMASEKIVPAKPGDIVVNVESLQEGLIKKSPVLALENAKRVISTMGDIVERMYVSAADYSFANNRRYLEEGRSLEELIDTIDLKVHDYLVRVSRSHLDDDAASEQARYVDTIRDFERIADHCQNLFDFFEHRHDNKLTLSDEAEAELVKLYAFVGETLKMTITSFKKDDKDLAEKIITREEAIDEMVRRNRRSHVQRCNIGDTECDDELFVDILSNIERIGDHCENIATNILHENYYRPEAVTP